MFKRLFCKIFTLCEICGNKAVSQVESTDSKDKPVFMLVCADCLTESGVRP